MLQRFIDSKQGRMTLFCSKTLYALSRGITSKRDDDFLV